MSKQTLVSYRASEIEVRMMEELILFRGFNSRSHILREALDLLAVQCGIKAAALAEVRESRPRLFKRPSRIGGATKGK